MDYQNRKDIDELIKAVDDLKYELGLTDKNQEAKINELKELINTLDEKYYDKSQIFSLFMNNSHPIKITFNDTTTLDAFLIGDEFFNELI